LNKQIFHLTKERTIVEVEKFDVGVDGSAVLKLLEPEFIKFSAALKSDFKSFKCNTDPITSIRSAPFSACTALLVATTTIAFGPTGSTNPA
jgi:hypothetical protein